MKKNLILFVCFLPALIFAQNQPGDEAQKPDYKQEGLFKALFHAGLNAGQIDGDNQVGYYKLGLDAGVGAMVRFHKYLSVSMSIDYSMKGALQTLSANKGPLDHYNTSLDYVEIPLMLNIHDKNIILFSVGPQLGVLVRYKEISTTGTNITDSVSMKNSAGHYDFYPDYGPPAKVDVEGVIALHFLIKKHFGVGVKFAYSLTSIRPAVPGNRFGHERNNVLTLDLMYIMDTLKKKS